MSRRIPKRVPGWITFFNHLTKPLMRLGVPMGPDVLLTVPGRKSGLPRSASVAIAEIAGRHWLVAPFGETDWVRNLRAAGQGTVTSGRTRYDVTARELDEDETLAFFRDVVEPYVRTRPFVRWLVRYVDGIPDDPERAAKTNIVFEVRPQARR